MKLQFGDETLQDSEMKKLGIMINLDYRVLICALCEQTIIPAKLYLHLNSKGRDGCSSYQGLAMGGRLALGDMTYCKSLISKHKLRDPFKSCPQGFVEAIPGLPVFEEQYCCSRCGHAYMSRGVLVKHMRDEGCSNGEEIVGPAQTFSPHKHLLWFGVKLPSHPVLRTDPHDSVMLFNKQFGSDPYSGTSQIQAMSHPREMLIFLTSENWLAEVEGMTGPEIREISWNAMPKFRKAVQSAVARYISGLVSELTNVGPSERLAIGDYNK